MSAERQAIELDAELVSAARRRAEAEGMALADYIEAVLRAAVGYRPGEAGPYRFGWKTHQGRVLPGVDVADRGSLFDAMEGRR